MDDQHTVGAAAAGQNYRRMISDFPDASSSRGPSKPSSQAAHDNASQADADTCRICRGEGSAEEPLFYPCKCSGSIKYVHQDCLMEWLSHSQKKHCELCKTPFRFTKLYAPNMPKTVPFYVFISHMAKYLFRNMLVWARAALVIMVWLVWLPYLMRRIWSALFWISDEGLSPIFGKSDVTNITGGATFSSDGATCPANPMAQMCSANPFSSFNTTPSGSTSQGTSLYGINITTDNPLSNMLLNIFLSSFYMGGAAFRDNASAVLQNVTAPILSQHPSLLSGVRFLQKISSSSPALGGFVIDVFEGQIITVVVVICFILIILVRDYVVQQQPDINLRAAFAAADNGAPREDAEPADAEVPRLVAVDPTEGLEEGDIDGLAGPEQEDDETSMQAVNGDMDEHDSTTEASDFYTGDEEAQLPLVQNAKRPRSANPTDRSNGPVVDIPRYTDMLREEAQEEDTAIARHMAHLKELKEERARSLATGQAQASSSPDDILSGDGESSQPESWRPRSEWDWPQEESRHSGKGKAPLIDESRDTAEGQMPTSRPRSATDGPQTLGGVNRLAHNNWSFSESHQEGPSAAADQPENARWGYVTPTPSVLAGSASSSPGDQTPSSSDAGGLDNAARRLSEQTVLNPADDASSTETPEDWEAIADLDLDLEPEVDQPREPEAVPNGNQQQPAGGIAQRVADFMWRDVEAIPPHELPPIPDPADDFFDHDQDMALVEAIEDHLDELAERDAEVLAAAAAAGIDAEAEAIEDAEDLEGVLELLGMRGPIAGLFQNALFCAFLVTITLVTGVFLPYNLGRLSIWMVANPIRPIRMVISLSKTVQDLAMLLFGFMSALALSAFRATVAFIRPQATMLAMIQHTVHQSWGLMENAGGSLRDSGVTDFYLISTDEVRNFSMVSHAALLSIKSQVAMVLSSIATGILFIFGGDYAIKAAAVFSWTTSTSSLVWQNLGKLPALTSGSWVIDLGSPDMVLHLDPELASWGAMDRLWVILGGYLAMCGITGLYLGRGSPIAGRMGQEWEATIIELLVQASGVMKVILIIGIEMLVFPLYCGLLLDVALLPLFEDATVMSRVMFTVNYPLTSVFVHWFVGTGYMFHFALFVSMCRKIMRKGVLYFIRDPDDAEFHPVRDVLERNVTTQLRKILFSAFVYGALVIVCLGGVVWTLSYGSSNVLPIYYSSNEPVLEFPIDLLFYNFLMPLAVKFYRPSDGLHAMYTWWFRKLARALRLTWFLFGERRIDEEGWLNVHGVGTLPGRLFLQIEGQDIVPMTWKDIFDGGHSKPAPPISYDELNILSANKQHLANWGLLIPNGRFVRAPASDQVKIPKSQRVFLDVSANNKREDGKRDSPSTDIYSTPAYQFVYVPPNFRLRIFLFILFIWIFAACTGVGFTIIPLIFGRTMFRLFIPADIRTNDIYAFSIGMYILGSAAYFAFRAKDTYLKAREWMRETASRIMDREMLRRASDLAIRAAKLVYTYSWLLVIFPFMVSSLMELYIVLPLDTYMYGTVLSNGTDAAVEPRHTIRVMQSWTIGIIYLKLAARFVVYWHRDSRLANATRAVLRHGWFEPDVKVLNRAFVVPGLSLWFAAVCGPVMLAETAIWWQKAGGAAPDRASAVLIYRFCFAVALMGAVALATLRSIFGVFRSWRVRIRDEAYLIGERLHNFSSPQQVLIDRERERTQTRIGWD